MEAYRDFTFARTLNQMDLITPDGQPVRWALNLLGARELKDRVYGPTLMLKVCERAAANGLPIFLYGSTAEVLERLSRNLQTRFPALIVSGMKADRFRDSSPSEDEQDIRHDQSIGSAHRHGRTRLSAPGKWVVAHLGRIQAPMIAVGAAFDFHAGTLPQAPKVLQDYGLEWLFRLLHEPKRLWRRYLILNPLFVLSFGRQLIRSRASLAG